MDFDSWTHRAADRQRARRLLAGYAVGVISLTGFGSALAMTSQAREQAEEAEENVQNVLLATEPEPEPEPEPEIAAVEPAPLQARPSGPVMPALSVPTEVPTDAPDETATQDGFNPYAAGDPYQFANQGGAPRQTLQKVVKVASPIAAAPAEPLGPSRVTADTAPPQKLSAPPFSYPDSARAAGIEGKVIVRFVVAEDGSVTDVQAMRGPDALRAAAVEMVKGYKYSPAMRDGKPVSVVKTIAINFKLTT